MVHVNETTLAVPCYIAVVCISLLYLVFCLYPVSHDVDPDDTKDSGDIPLPLQPESQNSPLLDSNGSQQLASEFPVRLVYSLVSVNLGTWAIYAPASYAFDAGASVMIAYPLGCIIPLLLLAAIVHMNDKQSTTSIQPPTSDPRSLPSQPSSPSFPPHTHPLTPPAPHVSNSPHTSTTPDASTVPHTTASLYSSCACHQPFPASLADYIAQRTAPTATTAPTVINAPTSAEANSPTQAMSPPAPKKSALSTRALAWCFWLLSVSTLLLCFFAEVSTLHRVLTYIFPLRAELAMLPALLVVNIVTAVPDILPLWRAGSSRQGSLEKQRPSLGSAATDLSSQHYPLSEDDLESSLNRQEPPASRPSAYVPNTEVSSKTDAVQACALALLFSALAAGVLWRLLCGESDGGAQAGGLSGAAMDLARGSASLSWISPPMRLASGAGASAMSTASAAEASSWTDWWAGADWSALLLLPLSMVASSAYNPVLWERLAGGQAARDKRAAEAADAVEMEGSADPEDRLPESRSSGNLAALSPASPSIWRGVILASVIISLVLVIGTAAGVLARVRGVYGGASDDVVWTILDPAFGALPRALAGVIMGSVSGGDSAAPLAVFICVFLCIFLASLSILDTYVNAICWYIAPGPTALDSGAPTQKPTQERLSRRYPPSPARKPLYLAIRTRLLTLLISLGVCFLAQTRISMVKAFIAANIVTAATLLPFLGVVLAHRVVETYLTHESIHAHSEAMKASVDASSCSYGDAPPKVLLRILRNRNIAWPAADLRAAHAVACNEHCQSHSMGYCISAFRHACALVIIDARDVLSSILISLLSLMVRSAYLYSDDASVHVLAKPVYILYDCFTHGNEALLIVLGVGTITSALAIVRKVW